jgi:SAM-dependent methyltransferase
VIKREGAEPFLAHHRRYDDWFVRHRAAYLSELLAVRALLPYQGNGLEIGVGTGRFAAPLGVTFGIDPAIPTLIYARERGVSVASGIAEALPFANAQFGYALLVTTICFVSSIEATLAEARRVLRPGGRLVIGFIDRESVLGREYLEHQAENVFYRKATFYSAAEVDALLERTGFGERIWLQTLSKPLAQIKNIVPVKAGTGQGAFVIVRARKMNSP